jgi:hypothetical protein
MARLDPFSLQMQITRMFEQEQSFFATTKVQDWLREHHEDPNAYNITFVQKPAPPGSNQVMVVEIGLQRRDGQPVDSWLLEEINRWS